MTELYERHLIQTTCEISQLDFPSYNCEEFNKNFFKITGLFSSERVKTFRNQNESLDISTYSLSQHDFYFFRLEVYKGLGTKHEPE